MTAMPPHERANLWVVCTAQFLCLAGMTAVLPLLPLYLQQIGVDGRDDLRWWTGILGAAPFAVAVFATPMWGALADRFGHKPMMVRSVVGIAMASVGMGFSHSPLALLAWRGLQGAVSGVFPAAVGLLSSLTPASRLGNALAILQATRSAGVLCGPLLGGVLADFVGIRPLFIGVGSIALVMAIVCAWILEERPERDADAAPEPPGTAASALRIIRQPAVAGMLGLILIYQSAVMASWPMLALWVEKLGVRADAVATTTGLVVFAHGLPSMMLATSWTAMVPRLGLRPLVGFAVVASGLTNIAVGLALNIEAVLFLRLLSGAAMAGFVPLSLQWLASLSHGGAQGRMAGISTTAMMAGNVIGSVVGSWIAVEISLEATFWIPGILLAIAGLFFLGVADSRR